MAGQNSIAERLDGLVARLEAVLAARDKAIAALRAERDALAQRLAERDATGDDAALRRELALVTEERDALRAASSAAEIARDEDLALRTEAAEALDRAIAELRAMADAQDESAEAR